MSTEKQARATEIEEIITKEFGVNADYVDDMLREFQRDPDSVDEEWGSYFDELVKKLGVNVKAAVAEMPAAKPVGPERVPLRGVSLRIAENMEASLEIPTATSQRNMPLKLVDENRRLLNQYLEPSGRKVSYTVLIARAVLKALDRFPGLNDSFEEVDGVAYRVRHDEVALGIAVDVVRKDGSRSLLAPNIKSASKLSFPELMDAYGEIVRRAREGSLQLTDFQGTTVTITNPGTIGTTGSIPRLMPGQGLIVATGAIEFPPEYHAMTPEALSWLGISKIMTITSTYDHRIIQGAESGAFLATIDEMLRGQHDFYEQVFSEIGISYRPYRWAVDRNPAILGEDRHRDEVRKQARVLELINAYRVRGHLIADLDPLGTRKTYYHPELDIETYGLTIWDLDREFISGGIGGTEAATLREILDELRRFYCGKVGVEYRHIQSPEEKEWIRARVEQRAPALPVEIKKQILWKLISGELFEKFLATKYVGQKRFSIEGAETLVALLDQLIESADPRGIQDITIGMSHRGRLNVIANVIGRFCERIFTSFEGSIHPKFPHDHGDVKYHQGASGSREIADGTRRPVAVSVMPNPSHLEFIDPVVEGVVRAKQETLGDPSGALAVLVHGDAAFAGEGIVAETLNLSQLPGYTTSGTIHVIVNNQLGFTTPPEEGRSSTYSTDVAKMVQAPIFHVNSDDVEAAYNVLQIALDYRQQFHKDVVVDVIGFRRHGHNEGDEPTYTQPVMYSRIRSHPGVRELYARKLVSEGTVDQSEVEYLMEERHRRYENAYVGAKEIVARGSESPIGFSKAEEPSALEVVETGVDLEVLRRIAKVVTTMPRGFKANPKITGLLTRRAKMIEREIPIDWGMAEALAFGSLVLEGILIRLTGQDTVRGTFSQRHATLYDTQTGEPWTPLAGLEAGQADFNVYDSPLSEAGALGFEYGYSVGQPGSLVLWEGQFGDFINAGQVIVDQFIASGEEKWNQTSRIVLLLPHGHEGQGPEHSSGRLERFLGLCAGGNMQVVNCTTSAQYFHLLRRQAKQSKPLIVMTPKSLLRDPKSGSAIDEFTRGAFHPLLTDADANPKEVERVLVCSGKVYYDLTEGRSALGDDKTAILRLEQLYPFAADLVREEIAEFPNATEVRWVQEEPANMGAWSFIEPRLRSLLGPGQKLSVVSRAPSSSPATGSHTIHQMEQRKLVKKAFGRVLN